MSNLFKGVRCLTQEQYEQLKNDGTITIDGETYLFEEDWLYVTPEDVSGIARNNKKRLDSLSKDYEATKLVVAENKNNITLLKSNHTTISNDLREVKNDINDLIATSVTLEGAQTIKGPKTFTENIYLANADGTVDRISHINNNFIIYSGAENGVALLNIDEGLDKIYAFNKELAFKEDITEASGSKVYVNNTLKDSIYFDGDPQQQLNNKLDELESSTNKELVNVTEEGNLEKTTFTANHLIGLKEQDLTPSKNVLKLENGYSYHPPGAPGSQDPTFSNTDNSVEATFYWDDSYGFLLAFPVVFPITLKPNTTYTISGQNPDGSGEWYIYKGETFESNYDYIIANGSGNIEQTFTTTDDTSYFLVFFTNAASVGYDYSTSYNNLQIEEGETATAFEPYKDTTEDKVVYQSDLEPVKTQVTENTKTLEESEEAIKFAESERKKSLGTYGAIIHEKELNNLVKGTVLWENGSPNNEFAPQTVSLRFSLANFTHIEVHYKNWNGEASRMHTTGKQLNLNGGILMYCSGGQYQTSVSRGFTIKSNTTIFFDYTSQYDYNSGSSYVVEQNNLMIPYRIIGYKE